MQETPGILYFVPHVARFAFRLPDTMVHNRRTEGIDNPLPDFQFTFFHYITHIMKIAQQSEVTRLASHLAPECPFSSEIMSLVKELGLLVFIRSLTIDNTMKSVENIARNRSIPNNIVPIIFQFSYLKILLLAVLPVQDAAVQ